MSFSEDTPEFCESNTTPLPFSKQHPECVRIFILYTLYAKVNINTLKAPSRLSDTISSAFIVNIYILPKDIKMW